MPAAAGVVAALRLLVTVLDPSTGLAVNGLSAADFVAPVRVESVVVSEQPVAMLLLQIGRAHV